MLNYLNLVPFVSVLVNISEHKLLQLHTYGVQMALTTPNLLKNICDALRNLNFNPDNITESNGELFFRANNNEHALEL